MDASLTTAELQHLWDQFHQSTVLIELALLAGCLGLAWFITWALRGRTPADARGSVLFGHYLVDGVLFPVLALGLAFLARRLLPASVPPAVFLLALPILSSLVVIRLTARVLRYSFPASRLMRIVERSVSWIAWVAVVLWVTGLLPLLMAELDRIQWTVGSTRVSLRSLIEGALNAVLVLVLALWLSATLEARLIAGATDNLSVRKIAANALRALLLLIGLMFALSAAGIDLTALGVLGGALGVGIGLGLQKLASNYVSGFVILAERSLRIGDLVRVDGFEGRIADINTRATIIRAGNGRESIVPNELLITQRVENASLSDPRLLLNTVVQVAYGSDVVALRERLKQAVAAVPRVLGDPAPEVLLQSFAADGLELNVLFWIDDAEHGLGNVRSDVNLAILRTLEEAGVEIPFPQRVLHHRDARPSALAPQQPAGGSLQAGGAGVGQDQR